MNKIPLTLNLPSIRSVHRLFPCLIGHVRGVLIQIYNIVICDSSGEAEKRIC